MMAQESASSGPWRSVCRRAALLCLWFCLGDGRASGTLPLLTAETRDAIDRAAAKASAEAPQRQETDLGGKRLEWILGQARPGLAQQYQIAQEIHAARLRSSTTLRAPKTAADTLQKLLDCLPDRMKPSEFSFSLTVESSPEIAAHTPGGGFLWISSSFLEALERQPYRDSMLALILGHELGHVCLGHTGRGIQAIALSKQAAALAEAGIDSHRLQDILGTRVAGSAGSVRFRYTPQQEYEADLFAVHLCRNAGIEPSQALDALRLLAQMEDPGLAAGSAPRDATRQDPGVLRLLFESNPKALVRLKRLNLELAGLPDDPQRYGLLVYSKQTGDFRRAGDKSLSGSQKAIVLVHGLVGSRRTYTDLIRRLVAESAFRQWEFLVFEYPNTDSLAKCGRFLDREMSRVFVEGGGNTDFIAHSAGGLVFRYYAEVRGGKFHRAIFQATPHGGSSLALLQPIVRLTRVWGDFNLSSPIPEPVQKFILDGQGQMMHDLQPESLFLGYLARKQGATEKYVVFRGQVMGAHRAAALHVAFALAKSQMRHKIPETVRDSTLRAMVSQWLERLVLPEEITCGDYVVAMKHASLRGAETHDTKCDHMSIKKDPQVTAIVTRLLSGE